MAAIRAAVSTSNSSESAARGAAQRVHRDDA